MLISDVKMVVWCGHAFPRAFAIAERASRYSSIHSGSLANFGGCLAIHSKIFSNTSKSSGAAQIKVISELGFLPPIAAYVDITVVLLPSDHSLGSVNHSTSLSI